ncbi:MAG: DUF3857 domain-containing protein [Bacteroidales bacterium]|nr:DUF3857 domain-containing protein [Bacteroidales bacterium]
MNKILLILFGIALSISKLGAENKYPVSDIPSELTKNAKVVIRESIMNFTIQSTDNGKLEVKEVITIMNKSGLRYAMFIELYNKFHQVKNIKGTYYDKFGNVIKKLRRDDLINYPAIAGYSLFDDNRIMFYNPEIDAFPFTVEYSYTIDYDGFLSYPRWGMYDDYNISCQRKELTVTTSKGIKFREHYQNLDIKPTITNLPNSNTSHSWILSNIPAIKEEPFSPDLYSFSPSLILAPTNFRMQGYDGNMESWKDFGNWIYSLNKDREALPDETIIKILNLTKNAKTDKEKIEILYKYMQDKTRYVNVSIGIGGWQPFEAETVDRLSYGDCKALTNYMKSLLDHVGIQSYYTIVEAGSDAPNIISDFSMNQFNHAFLCVPQENDTIWLECTNQKIPAGYTGDFTDDRDVLIIKENNSELVHTKIYSIEENTQKRCIQFTLNEFGEGIADIKTKYIGLGTENVYYLIDAPHEDVKRYHYKHINIPDFTIESFNYTVDRKRIPIINETMKLEVKNFASAMGNHLIVPINLISKIEKLPRSIKDRNSEILIKRSNCKIDSINFMIPEGYVIENIPETTVISTKYGEYKTEIVKKEHSINYKRTLSMFKGNYPPEEYIDFRDFLSQISKADNAKFVLVKN